jgi:hypothetical protein
MLGDRCAALIRRHGDQQSANSEKYRGERGSRGHVQTWKGSVLIMRSCRSKKASSRGATDVMWQQHFDGFYLPAEKLLRNI